MSKPRPFRLPSAPPPAPPTPLSLAAGGLVLLVLLVSLALFSLSVYQLPAGLGPVLGLCLVGWLVSLVVWALPRRRGLAVLVTLLAAGVLLLLNAPQLLYGAQASLEALAAFWTENTYFTVHYTLSASLPDPQHQAAVSAFVGAVLALLALPLGWAVLRRRAFSPAFLLTLPWLLPAFLAEVALDWPALAAICACWACLLLSGLAARGDANGGARITLLALPVCLAVIWGVLLLLPYQDYTQPAWAVHLRQELFSWDGWSREEEEEEGTASGPHQGQEDGPQAPRLEFSTAGPRQYAGRGVLRVTTTQPGPLYLRGEVYQDYTSQAWTGVTPESADQLSPLDGDSPATATITYLTSPRSTAYLPYQTHGVEGLQVSPASPLVFPAARRDCSVDYTPLDGEPTPQISPVSYDPVAADAYANYLDVPQEVSGFLLDWFDQAMADLEADGNDVELTATGDYASILNTVSLMAQLLERSAQYDLRTPRTPTGRDFVSYFLGESHRGYCVHFATAATLLLRLQGIPARYVSGYAVTVSSAAPGEDGTYTAQALDFNEHAWVEVYLESYGWYPVEVTPSSTAPQRPLSPQLPAASAPPTPSPTPTPGPGSTPAPSVPPEAPGNGVSLWWLVWVVPFAALGMALWLVRHLRGRSWRKMCRDRDTNAAVLAVYRWAGVLERWGGKAGEETEALARKARFSPHTLTQEERRLVVDQFRDEVARLKQSAPVRVRLLLWLLYPV